MRCESCGAMNPDGRAICSECGAPLTRYADDVTGRVRAETRARVRQARMRPPAVPIAAALAGVWAVLGPAAYAVGAFRARPVTNAEGTNYIWSALGAVPVFFGIVTALPFAVGLAIIAWGVWTQRAWAWHAVCGAILVDIALAMHMYPESPVVAVFRGLVGLALAAAWYQPSVRQWYGVGRHG
jgi:hypothetical protein